MLIDVNDAKANAKGDFGQIIVPDTKKIPLKDDGRPAPLEIARR